MARIRTIKPELPNMREISAVEAAEFRGLFFGEGHLDLVRNSSLQTLYPRARIAVRDDDVEVVLWCKSLFGGNISRRAATRSTAWQLTGKERIGRLLDALEGGVIPSKKRSEVALMREAWGLKGARGVHESQASRDRLYEIRDELKQARKFKGGPASAKD